jgi:hypothetical protein
LREILTSTHSTAPAGIFAWRNAMSRNGSGVYSLPPGSTISDGTTADAADINTPLADIAADLNVARPIVAGGTGASSVAGAQTAFKIPPFDGVATISGAWTHTGSETFNDSVALRLGTGADTTFLHNGTNTIVTDASAGLIVKTASFKAQNAAGTEDMIEAVQDSFVKLRHNNTARLTTTSTGVDIVGLLNGDTIGGSMVSTSIATDTGSTTKVPHVAAVEARLLGYGQTIQNVLASRAHSTSYQNTTGKAIQVNIKAISTTSTGRDIEASPDNSAWVVVGFVPGTGATINAASCPIIPDGWYYRINGAATVAAWTELR